MTGEKRISAFKESFLVTDMVLIEMMCIVLKGIIHTSRRVR